MDMATVLRHDGKVGLRYERRLRHAPEKVWAALTESEQLAQWLPCDIVGERREGAALTMPFWPEVVAKYSIEDPVLSGEIRVWDPPSVFELLWDDEVLRFELTPADDGTVLVLTVWLGTSGAPPASAAAGYHRCLDHLVQLLDTGSAPPIAEGEHPAELEARYEAVVGDEGSVHVS